MNFKAWLQTILTAAVSGAATGVATAYAGGSTKGIGAAAIAGAAVSVAGLHLPQPNWTTGSNDTAPPKPQPKSAI